MAETIILDPSAETTGRTEIDITDVIAAAGPDWGDAAIEPYYAQADLGEIPIDYRTPNRVITIPLILRDRGANSFNEWRTMLQAKVGLWQREGGVISRQTSIGTVYADVVSAALKLGGSWLQAHRDADPDAVLTLTCIPDWYEAEIELTPTVAGTGDVIRVVTPTRGDHPSRVRIVVDDTEGVSQNGVLWGIRSRHYNAGTAAALAYQAESLDPLDSAAGTALSGASGGTVVRHGDVGTNWTPVLGTDIGGTLALAHQGTYRVWCRAYSASATPPRIRFAWDVGDLTNPVANSPASPAVANSFYTLDLGEIRLDPAPVGTHRWRGMIQAAGDDGGENISIDKIWFQPLDEYAGALRAPLQAEIGLADYLARDEFNQGAGDLATLTAPVGGAWAGAGDANDFAIDPITLLLQRTATSDSDTQTGRYGISGASAVAAQVVQVDFYVTAAGAGYSGVIARYTNTSNWFRAVLGPTTSGAAVLIGKRVSGTVTNFVNTTVTSITLEVEQWYTIRAYVDIYGYWAVWLYRQGGSPGSPVWSGQDSALATGGGIATGKPGIYDYNNATANTRVYGNFAAWAPDPDAVIHANQSLELRTSGAFRESLAGTFYGPVSWVSGDLPRLPAPGLESRSVQVLVKNSRGDLEQLPDSSPDDSLNVSVFYRPSYLFVPAQP